MRRLAGTVLPLALALAAEAYAFPPYRSTDAETAGADVVELRLGLLRIQRRDGRSNRLTPLSRLNIGMGDHYEIISELEYAPDVCTSTPAPSTTRAGATPSEAGAAVCSRSFPESAGGRVWSCSHAAHTAATAPASVV